MIAVERAGASCDFTDALLALVGANDQLVVLHSSLPHLGIVSRRLRWQVIGAIRTLLHRGTTVVVPTFTFSFTKGEPFRRDGSPSEVGVVGDWCMQLPEFVRTPNPLFSVAVAGPLQGRLLECDHHDCYGPASVLAAWERWNGRFIFLGAPWSALTFVHRMEEEHAVPYRDAHEFCGLADLGAGMVETAVRAYVRDETLASRMDLSAFVQLLIDDRLVVSTRCGRGRAHSVLAADVAAVARRELPANPFLFLANGPLVAERIAVRNRWRASEPLRIVIAGPGELRLVAAATQRAFDDLVDFPRVEVREFSRAGWQGGWWDASLEARGELGFVALRLRDIWPAGLPADQVEAEFERVLERLARWRQGIHGPLVVSELIEDGGALCLVDQERRSAVHRLNELLYRWAAAARDVYVLSVSALFARCGCALADSRLEVIGASDYSSAYAASLASEYVGIAADSLGLSIRMIVLDLDGTLWEGTLAEGGAACVNVRHGANGRSFYRFQLALRQLVDAGLILAIASKNSEQEALATLEKHPDLVLRPSDFAAWRLNWEPKWRNVRALCDEVGISPANVLFIDDSAVECEEMAAHNPQVHILRVPDDPARLVENLWAYPLLRRIQPDTAGRARTASYRSRSERAAIKSRAGDLEAYYAVLKPTLHLSDLSNRNRQRALELVRKTNRFNTSLARYSLEQLASGALTVIVLGAEDLYSPLEDVGVLAWRHLPSRGQTLVELWVLSCRVLGRGIEEGMLGWLVQDRRREGDSTLTIRIQRGERNAVTLEWLNAQGFAVAACREHAAAGLSAIGEAGDLMALDLRVATCELPSWLTVRDTRKAVASR